MLVFIIFGYCQAQEYEHILMLFCSLSVTCQLWLGIFCCPCSVHPPALNTQRLVIGNGEGQHFLTQQVYFCS